VTAPSLRTRRRYLGALHVNQNTTPGRWSYDDVLTDGADPPPHSPRDQRDRDAEQQKKYDIHHRKISAGPTSGWGRARVSGRVSADLAPCVIVAPMVRQAGGDLRASHPLRRVMFSTPLGDLRGRQIVVAEDQRVLRFCVLELLAPTGVTCVETVDGDELAAALATLAFDIAIADVRMPKRTGIEVLRERRALMDETPFVLITGAPDPALLRGVTAATFLPKPFTRDELFAAVGAALAPGLGPRGTSRTDGA
jgi:CheY-like chemotaxis protein